MEIYIDAAGSVLSLNRKFIFGKMTLYLVKFSYLDKMSSIDPLLNQSMNFNQ